MLKLKISNDKTIEQQRSYIYKTYIYYKKVLKHYEQQLKKEGLKVFNTKMHNKCYIVYNHLKLNVYNIKAFIIILLNIYKKSDYIYKNNMQYINNVRKLERNIHSLNYKIDIKKYI